MTTTYEVHALRADGTHWAFCKVHDNLMDAAHKTEAVQAHIDSGESELVEVWIKIVPAALPTEDAVGHGN